MNPHRSQPRRSLHQGLGLGTRPLSSINAVTWGEREGLQFGKFWLRCCPAQTSERQGVQAGRRAGGGGGMVGRGVSRRRPPRAPPPPLGQCWLRAAALLCRGERAVGWPRGCRRVRRHGGRPPLRNRMVRCSPRHSSPASWRTLSRGPSRTAAPRRSRAPPRPEPQRRQPTGPSAARRERRWGVRVSNRCSKHHSAQTGCRPALLPSALPRTAHLRLAVLHVCKQWGEQEGGRWAVSHTALR